MKSRDRQRKMRRAKSLFERLKEELPDPRDCCGIPDPTPYEAIRNCILREIADKDFKEALAE